MKVVHRPRRSASRRICRASFEALENRTMLSGSTGVVKIMPLGDSITEAFPGHASYRYWLWNQLANAGYTADFVGSEFPPGVNGGPPLYPGFDWNNEGHSGYTTADLENYINPSDTDWVNYISQPQNAPNIVLLHIGTNDIIQGMTDNESDSQIVSTAVTNIEKIVDDLRNINPNVEVLLAKIIPTTTDDAQTQELNAALSQVVTDKSTGNSPVTLVDQYTGFNAASDTYDGIHPNETGEKKLAQNWYNALTPLLQAPTPPPAGTYVDTLTPKTTPVNGWGPIQYESSNGETGIYDGEMITLNGVKYMRGLGVNSFSDITYDITGDNYTDFKSDVGIDDEVGSNGSVNFQVVVDGNVLFDSGVMTGDSATQSIDVAIPTGAHTLDLVVTNGGDDSAFDHADWAMARLVTSSGQNPTVPNDPSDLDGSLKSDGSEIDLTWHDNSDNETGFRVERKARSDGRYVQIADLPAGSNTFADTNISPGVSYFYRVYAYNNAGNSNDTDEKNIVVPPPPNTTYLSDTDYHVNTNGFGPVENDRSNGEAGSNDGNTITLNGVQYAKGIGTNALSVMVFQLNGNFSEFISDIGIDDEVGSHGSVDFQVYFGETQVYDSGLMTGDSATKTVDLDVTGVQTLTLGVVDGGDGNAFDHGDWAGARLLTASAPTTPAAPVLGGQLNVNNTEIDLSWTDTTPDSGITDFLVERKTGASGTYAKIADLTGATFAHSYQDTDVQPGNTYYYQVIAVNSGQNSGPSNEVNVAVPAAPAPPDVPILSGQLNGSTPHLSWTDTTADGDITGFRIQRKTGVNGTYSQIADLTGATFAHSYDDTTAQAGNTYYYEVDAYSTVGGTSNFSNEVSVAVPAAIPAAPVLSGTLNSSEVDLSWSDTTDPSNITGYRVMRKTGAAGTYAQIDDLHGATFATTYADTTIQPGNTYFYEIIAYNSGGPSDASNEKSFVVPQAPGSVFLSDLNYVAVHNGWGPVEKDRSNGEQGAADGKTITLNGVTYAKGLGVHSPSEIDYALSGNYNTFISDIGVDDEVGNQGSVDFQVWIDGVKKYDSGVMTGASSTQTINLDVSGAQLIQLIVTDGGNGNAFDHSDWAGARLITGTVQSVNPPQAPTDLAADYNSATNKIDLSWDDPADNATGFRIERKISGGTYSQIADLNGTTFATSYSDANISPGVTYFYRVQAYNSGGSSGFTTEMFATVPSTVTGVTYVSDLPFTVQANGWGPAERDMSNGETAAGDGRTLTLNGVTYAKGLGVHATSQITVPLNGQYTQFLASIGIDDEVGNSGNVDFQVWVDGVQKFDSGAMTGSSSTQNVAVDVTGATTMLLIVTPVGNGNAYDHADWANARLVVGQGVTLPSAPTGLTANYNTVTKQVDLSWADAANDETGFLVQSMAAGGSWEDVQMLPASTTSWSDLGPFLANTTYSYRVIATTSSEQSQPSLTASITTPAATTQTWVSDLTPVTSTNGWGPVEKDMSNGEIPAGDGRLISIRGHLYAKGLGTNATSQIIYNLNGQYTTFTSDVGIDDEVNGRGSVDFQVWVDGVKKYDSGTVRGTDAAKTAVVNVAGANQIWLVVTDAGDGNAYDHADWAGAQLTA